MREVGQVVAGLEHSRVHQRGQIASAILQVCDVELGFLCLYDGLSAADWFQCLCCTHLAVLQLEHNLDLVAVLGARRDL